MSESTVIVTEHVVTQISERRFRVTIEMEWDRDVVVPPGATISSEDQVTICHVMRDAVEAIAK